MVKREIGTKAKTLLISATRQVLAFTWSSTSRVVNRNQSRNLDSTTTNTIDCVNARNPSL
jgi:hypothetical protein